ncbi:hypothetical protein Tco_0661297 [Tanacetum coccineum]
MASLDHRLNSLFWIKECMTCGALYTADFCCSKGGLEDKILVPKTPQNCAICGNPVDDLYCRHCVFVRKCLNEEPFVFNQDPGENFSQSPCKSCGNGAHIGYNCPPKVPIISNLEQCNQTINELPQTLPSVHYEDENSFTYDSKPNSFNDSPSVLTHPPQLQFETYLCELCGNNAHYGYDCPPQFPLVYEQEPCYNQNFNDNYFPQNFQSSSQQYNCCENCGGPHKTFHCRPMNEDYYEQNSCYDPNSFGFDQFQPYTVNHLILNAQNEYLNSQNKLMEQMTSICDMVGQIMQKKEEERRIVEEQAAKDRYWKIPICYDDDEDYTIVITPVLSTKEPVDSLIMEDEHLDTVPATESDEVIKSSVENLVPIPSEFKGIFEDTCDVPVCEDPSTFDALSDHSEILSNSNDHDTSSDDESYENIEYVEASPLNLEYDGVEEESEDQEEKEFNLEDIFQIQDIDPILEEFAGELAHIAPIPPGIVEADFDPNDDTSSDDDSFENIEYIDASPSYSELVSLEKVNDVDQEEKEFDLEDILQIQDVILREKLLNVHRLISNIESLKVNPTPDRVFKSLSSFPIPVMDSDQRGSEIIFLQNVEDDDSFTFVIRTFLPFLTYPEASPLSCSTGSEDTIFDPDIIPFPSRAGGIFNGSFLF